MYDSPELAKAVNVEQARIQFYQTCLNVTLAHHKLDVAQSSLFQFKRAPGSSWCFHLIIGDRLVGYGMFGLSATGIFSEYILV